MRSWSPAIGLLLVAACNVPTVVDGLDREAPPPGYGRPDRVRLPARAGAWIGGVAGGLVSVATLPITYPISLLAEEPLGMSRQEFLFAPVSGGAAIGHFTLGAPLDLVHYVGYRAWVDHPRPYDYEFTPMRPPAGPAELESPPASGDDKL
jgi:hypothetical protein